MHQDFDREVLSRLPLAEAVLSLWLFVCDDQHLDRLYDRHRGATYQKKITFPLIAQLVREALLQPDGSGHQSFCHARADGTLNAALSSTYEKLAHLPPAVSEAFLAEGADRLRQVLPDAPALADPLPVSLHGFEVVVLDGKVVKRVPRRLKPARQRKGGLLGGKGLAALHVRSGLILALATDPDGEANDARLVPDLLPQVRSRVPGPRLWVADRQFCDLIQTTAFTATQGDHFLVRYHSKVHFCPDPTRPVRQGQDNQGRVYEQAWGWLGREGNKQRRYVRQITLHRPGEEDILLVTDLRDAESYPAEDLLALYLARWGIERRIPTDHRSVPPEPFDRDDAAGDAVPIVVLSAVVRHDPGGAWLCGGGPAACRGDDLDGVAVHRCEQAVGGVKRVGGGGGSGGVVTCGNLGGDVTEKVGQIVGNGVE